MLLHVPGFHLSQLAVAVASMYLSLATTYHMRCVKYTCRWEYLSSCKSPLQYIENIADVTLGYTQPNFYVPS